MVTGEKFLRDRIKQGLLVGQVEEPRLDKRTKVKKKKNLKGATRKMSPKEVKIQKHNKEQTLG